MEKNERVSRGPAARPLRHSGGVEWAPGVSETASQPSRRESNAGRAGLIHTTNNHIILHNLAKGTSSRRCMFTVVGGVHML